MRFILNIIWLVLAGFWMAIAYALAALIMFILIITIPFGIQALKIGVFALWPFGRTVIKREDAGAPSFIGNLLWLILAGWWLALANFKLIPISLWPFGREIVPASVAHQLGEPVLTVPGDPSSSRRLEP